MLGTLQSTSVRTFIDTLKLITEIGGNLNLAAKNGIQNGGLPVKGQGCDIS